MRLRGSICVLAFWKRMKDRIHSIAYVYFLTCFTEDVSVALRMYVYFDKVIFFEGETVGDI